MKRSEIANRDFFWSYLEFNRVYREFLDITGGYFKNIVSFLTNNKNGNGDVNRFNRSKLMLELDKKVLYRIPKLYKERIVLFKAEILRDDLPDQGR